MSNSKKVNTTVAKIPEKLQAAEASQYADLVGEIKQRIRHAQTRAWMAVNAMGPL